MNQDVIVIDSQKRFLNYTTKYRARVLLKGKKAKIFSRNPFAIMLLKSVPVSSLRRKKTMQPVNFTQYFKDERDVFVQNISNAQVSIEFPANDRYEGFTFLNTRDPVILTNHIPFNMIKNSMDFRKMLSRRPPALMLLTQEEYDAYYSAKAGRMNSTTEEVMGYAEEQRRKHILREKETDAEPKPLHEVVESGTGPGGATRFGERQRVHSNDLVGEDEIITPRVLHLCNQAKNEVPEQDRMPSSQLLNELEGLPNLTLDDYEYIRANAFYKTVKKWARMRAQELIEAQEAKESSDS